MTFDKLCDNLNLLMSEAQISADELSRRINIPASTIKKIRNRQNPNPTLTTLIPLTEYFNVSLSQLIGHEPLPNQQMKDPYKQSIKPLGHIPLISWQEALEWPNTQTQPHNIITTGHEYDKNTFALRVEDDDWENLSKGTVLIVDTSVSPEHRDFVIIHKTGQPLPSLKQLLFDDGQAYLKPIVQGYKILPFSQEHRLIGVVTEYKKQLKINVHGNIADEITENNSS